MKSKFNIVINPVLLLLSMTVQAENIPAIDCMIEPNVMVELSSPVSGVLHTLTVDKSDEVIKGQLVATLKSEVEIVRVQTSAERLKLSNVEFKRAVELYHEKAITLSDKDKSENEKTLFELELKQAKANLELKQIKSPIDGVVVKRYAMPGEFVETKPILQLAQLDPLKIEVVSPVSNYGKIVKGMYAKINPEYGKYENLIAEVVVVDKVIDAASGTFGIRLELANKDHTIPGGIKCQVSFLSDSESAKYVENVRAVSAKSVVDIPVEESTDDALICSSVGPYKKQSTLNKLIDELGVDLKQIDLRTDTVIKKTYLVVSETFPSNKEAEEAMRSMRVTGIKDIAVLYKGEGHRLALGLYSRQSLAENRITELKKIGYEVVLKHREKLKNRYWADVTYMPKAVETLNKIISENRRVACDDTIKLSLMKK